jgi:cytoskeletal protein RodZ
VSSVVNPVGPEEPSTYWRRRAALLVGLLVVLWLGWWLLQAAFGSNDEPSAQEPSASPSFGLSMSPEPTDSTPEPSASGSVTPSPSPSPSARVECVDSDVEVVAVAADATTGVGGGMALTLTVTNTGATPCNRDVGAGANEMRITSGSAVVWSSDFCNPSTATDVRALEPGKPFTTSVTWPGTVTVEGCPADQPLAQPGSYRVVARNGAVESEPVAFTVE